MAKLKISEKFEVYRSNMYPKMLRAASLDLELSEDSLTRLGIGFNPDHQSWVFPERDHQGAIIGLIERYPNGDKKMVTRSKRGLAYILNPNYRKGKKYVSGEHNWTRVSDELPCPICGKPDWCLISSDDPYNPAAVLCARISEGSRKEIPGCGFLHKFSGRQTDSNGTKSLLNESEFPVIVVEGHTDVLAATDIGLVAVGRPSAKGKIQILKKLLRGHDVIVLGENDPNNAGQQGMELAFNNLSSVCDSVVKVLPPKTVNDLREWVGKGATKEEVLKWAKDNGEKAETLTVFKDDIAYNIAMQWVKQFKTVDDFIILRNYRGQWVEFRDGCYRDLDNAVVRGEIYDYLDNKKVSKIGKGGEIEVVPYKPTRAKVSDILDALNSRCPIQEEPPIWLDGGNHPDPRDLVVFTNGILNTTEYFDSGKIELAKPTPALFSYNVIPYDFDTTTDSKIWDKFLDEIFEGNEDKKRLLAQWFGYNLVPDMTQEKMMLFTGIPRSGKSTTLDTMAAMLGPDQYCYTSLPSMCGRFGFQPMQGKYAALIGDARTPRRQQMASAMEKILQITGGDAVSIDRKGIQALSAVHLKTRFTFTMNDLPAFTDHSKALESRMLILEFDKSFAGKEDRSLKLRLKKEARAGKLINFALAGLKDLREQGRFILPESSNDLLESFIELVSPIDRFLQDCCIESDNDARRNVASTEDMYNAWKCWCEDNGHRPGKKCQLGRWIQSSWPNVEKIRLRDENDNRIYSYGNIKLQPWVYTKYLGKPN